MNPSHPNEAVHEAANEAATPCRAQSQWKLSDGTTVICCLCDGAATVPKSDAEQHRRCVEAMQRVATEILTQDVAQA